MQNFGHRACHLILGLCSVAIAVSPAGAATLTTYSDEAAFLAALGPSFTQEGFDGYPSGTLLTTQVPGVSFSSPLSTQTDYFAIQSFASPGAVSAPNTLAGGFVPGSPDLGQVVVLDFAPDIVAFGFFVDPLAPDSTIVEVRVDFRDQTFQSLNVQDANGSGAEFLGLRSDTPILRITFLSAKDNDGQQGFHHFGLDNLTWAAADTRPPLCSAVKAVVNEILGFNGTTTDSAPGDSGVASIVLTDATNVTLTCDSPFPPSCGSIATPTPIATWRVAPTDPQQNGQGEVVATDAQGNSCTFTVTFVAFGGGSISDLQVCATDAIEFLASNPASAPAGQVVCGSNLPGLGDPVFPPGYEPSPATDPFPCTVLTIKSPISGLTSMDLVKDGDFEPRLRLLYSRFDGVSFPPFMDITAEVEQITTVVPDPTLVGGQGPWSQVKIACAVQSELCNGLDDDGDGLVDEGLPVDEPARDCDTDGYPQCATTGTTADDCRGGTVTVIPGVADCNDQIPTIHPGADETCNGMDDDCDGAIDEDIAATTCGVGVCTRTVESCVDHVPQTCTPGTPGTEACNGLDDDCDDATDEDLGSASCGVGACAVTVDYCAGGVPQTCVPGTPGTEACNGLDDDCDGSADEEYNFDGYLPPVSADGRSIFQQRSTIPFKFRLSDCGGMKVTSATATIEVIPYADHIVGTVLESVPPNLKASAGAQYTYDAKVGQYIYNLGTRNLLPGTSYTIRTRISDGSVHDVVISLK